MEFKDITPHCVVSFEAAPESFDADKEYTVEAIGSGSYGSYITLFTGADEWGESDGYMEDVTEEEYISCVGTVVKEVTSEQKDTILQLDNLIAEMRKMSKTITDKAKESGLDYDVVVISDTDSLAEWYSSRC